ncbi:hypothetical protein predicted by Glimmer/Critica [Sorangium cellulosum So ce56]|uniref:Uncharacterized protein n=1 Tax=Sorangium cellulosum (strain So ce56) TaxID=448385 RepID=A9FAH6_SORC5|nr:hypothetical protein predicted by Glimmer/Critica [Sorangium cellulosum So ce56]
MSLLCSRVLALIGCSTRPQTLRDDVASLTLARDPTPMGAWKIRDRADVSFDDHARFVYHAGMERVLLVSGRPNRGVLSGDGRDWSHVADANSCLFMQGGPTTRRAIGWRCSAASPCQGFHHGRNVKNVFPANVRNLANLGPGLPVPAALHPNKPVELGSRMATRSRATSMAFCIKFRKSDCIRSLSLFAMLTICCSRRRTT